ncbi:hypothetical protein A3H53_00090 [Candidatus Nomurabacteria bacterium RIFCSPLOWO2_02_FULL_40_10]|uniref:Uncharacterized protein n=2 Tax=Candidatus Nomuraibacteriota TaxID=1752729 RepID=A0A1F6Y077_9BACT|nr:MAG: hypothetical protein A2642_03345 [Candidatus Nomurabacteria bacterium RIFCSPHIGHO2_01_FULL_39_10]OGI99658.1 MAG: hypothetical protein A3H53_00090 [Candidatus Nomurabacteria bacterium RIFCSPLOWO2_02_FULL_40_10]
MEEKLKQYQDIKIKLSPEELLAKKKEYLEFIRGLRFDYIEEFPLERLLPGMPNYHKYKCRTNFFNGVFTTIEYLKRIKLINSSETKEECEEFLKFCDTIRGTKRFYTQVDIDKANKVLDVLIKELS